MRISILMLLAFTLSACGSLKDKFGRKPGETLVTIKLNREHNLASTVYPMSGGVWIILKSESGADFMKSVFLPNETAQVQISAPNGMYKAGAIAWEGNSSSPCTPGTDCFPGQGQAKCDIAFQDTTFPLTGTSFTIPFTLTQIKCQNPPWGSSPFSDVTYNPTGDPNFPQVNFSFVSGSPYMSGSYNQQLVLNLVTKNASGVVKAGEVKLGCYPVTSGSSSTQYHVPLGKSGDSVFSYTLSMYSSGDTSCAGTVLNYYEFANGLASPITGSSLTIPTSSAGYGSQINTIQIH